jgi:hypothetical protein
MRLQLLGVVDRGQPNKERLHLRAFAAIDLSSFVVCISRKSGVSLVRSGPLSAFWFPTTHVASGDHVVLFSGGGANTSRLNPDGSTSHFFYWGLTSTVWNAPEDCAVVFEAGSWETTQ